DILVPAFDSRYLYKFNGIRGALGDSEGNTYILGHSGFYHFDAHNKLLFRYDHYSKEQASTVGFQFGVSILWLSNVEILITAIDGAHIYNTQTHEFNKVKPNHPFLQELGILPHEAYLMRQVKPGSLLFIRTATDSMLYIDTKSGRKVFSKTCIHNLTDEFGWRSRLFEVNDSLFYLTCQQNGFFKIHLDPRSGKIVVDPEKYLPTYLCIDFVAGTDGRLWVATRAGLLKETGNASSGRDVSIPPDILKQCPAANIRQLLCYKDKLYAACAGNAGLLVFDKNTLSFLYRISFKKYHSNENVFSLLQARDDTLLVGTNGPLFWLKTSTKAIGVVKLEGWDSIHNWISAQYKD
ncbi:MAG TPA: hypothetical protein VLD19_09520, partial [Chitinophagaceae bacterium]|nr:hypothetical protein [Chitinophagaceae bacterium]